MCSTKKLFLKISQYSQVNTCEFNKVVGLHNFSETYYKIKKKTWEWFFLKPRARKHAYYVCFHKLILATRNMDYEQKHYVHFHRWVGLSADTRRNNYICIGGKKLRFILSDYSFRKGNHAQFELLSKIF